MISTTRTVGVFARLRWRAVNAGVQAGGRAAVIEGIATISLLVLGLVGGGIIFWGLRIGQPGVGMESALVGGCALLLAATTGFAMVVGVNNSLDLRVIATEPLSGFQRALGQLVMATVGPTGIAMALVGIGTVLGAPRGLAAVPLAAVGVATLLITNMMLARSVINLLGILVVKWPRAGQLVSALAGLAVMIGYQIVFNVLPDVPRQRLRSITDVIGWLPGASIGRALSGATNGGFGTVVDWGYVAWTAIWIPVLLWLFVRSSERLVVAVAAGNQKVVRDRSGWRRWFGSGVAGAVATRTAITTVRSPRRMVEWIMGSAVGGASIVVPPLLASGTVAAELSNASAVDGVITVTGFGACFTAVMAASNMFGADGPAIAHEFLAGVSMTDMLRGKRRFAVAVGLPVAIVGTLFVAVMTGNWSVYPINVAVALAGVFGGSGVALVQSSWAPFAAPDDVNPFAFNAGPAGIIAVVIWIVSLITLIVSMAPVLIGLGFAAANGSGIYTAVFAVLAVPWAYALSLLAEWFSGSHLNGHEAGLIDNITPA